MMQRRLLLIIALMSAVALALSVSKADAGIRVYDKDGQYLGILVDIRDGNESQSERGFVEIFIPSLGKFARIQALEDDNTHGDIVIPRVSAVPINILFETPGCFGTLYIILNESPMAQNDIFYSRIIKDNCTGYYSTGQEKTIIQQSHRDMEFCMCNLGDGIEKKALELTPVDLPFTTPVSFPLQFKYRRGGTVVIPLQ